MVQLVTPEQLASHLGQDLDRASAEQAIETASAFVEAQTGMAFTTRTATVRLPGTSAPELVIPLRPLREVGTASIGGVLYFDFEVGDGVLWRSAGWRTRYGAQQVDVTVTYGFAAAPDDIKGVVREVAAVIYEGRQGVSSEGIDDYRANYTGALSETSQKTLAAYGAGPGTVRLQGR